MTTWTRSDGLVVEVDENCTTHDQLMAYLDEAHCDCGAKYNRITEKHCRSCHCTCHYNNPSCPSCGNANLY